MTIKSFTKPALSIAACITLAACQTTGSTSQQMNSAQVDAAMQRAAQAAGAGADAIPASASSLEKVYSKDATNPEKALRYAVALREADSANKASVVLGPFAESANSAPGVKTEYAAIQLALGNNETAEKYAQKAVQQDPNDARAYHYLGIALDAQGKHPEAEKAFRKGLDMWQGDPTPIMNNLALNLSAQGYLDEAAEILEKAKSVSPNRVEIERNLRIITALRQSENPTTPTPGKKPTKTN